MTIGLVSFLRRAYSVSQTGSPAGVQVGALAPTHFIKGRSLPGNPFPLSHRSLVIITSVMFNGAVPKW